MNITKLIEKLTRMKDLHGNVEVTIDGKTVFKVIIDGDGDGPYVDILPKERIIKHLS